MNKALKKLNNQKGASITWALLIFLVCTVVGSAVLVAGTAAAGRMSKLAENDQRYYAVTSTAGLLRDVLGQEVKVTRSVSTGSDETNYSIRYSDNAGNDADPIVKSLVMRTMGWPDTTSSPTTDKTAFWEKDRSSSAVNVPLTLKGSNTGLQNAGCNTTLNVGVDGSISATVQKEKYSMLVTFQLNRVVQTKTTEKVDVFSWKMIEAKKLTG